MPGPSPTASSMCFSALTGHGTRRLQHFPSPQPSPGRREETSGAREPAASRDAEGISRSRGCPPTTLRPPWPSPCLRGSAPHAAHALYWKIHEGVPLTTLHESRGAGDFLGNFSGCTKSLHTTLGHVARLPGTVHGSGQPPVVARLKAATGGCPYTAGWINLMWTDLAQRSTTRYATAGTTTLRRSSIACKTACVTATVRMLSWPSGSRLRSPRSSPSKARSSSS